jgi:phytol kinase
MFSSLFEHYVQANHKYNYISFNSLFGSLLVCPGKHKYRVKAFMVDRWYWRSYEGSAAVYLVSVAAVVGGSIWTRVLSDLAIWMAVIFVPPVATLAEAVSPHTWDNAAIIASSGIMLQLVDLVFR